MKEISERTANALGGVKAVVEPLTKTSNDALGARIIWKDGLVQTNYRMGEMGYPASIPDQKTAAAYLEQILGDGYFVIIKPRREP